MSVLLWFLDGDEQVEITTTLDQVGALLRARTRDSNGVEQGTFTDDTRPTATEAAALLDMATLMVSTDVGSQVPATAASFTEQAVALRTALLIELSYFPEQIASGESPYLQLRELGDAQIQGIIAIKQDNQPGSPREFMVPIQSSVVASRQYALEGWFPWSNGGILP